MWRTRWFQWNIRITSQRLWGSYSLGIIRPFNKTVIPSLLQSPPWLGFWRSSGICWLKVLESVIENLMGFEGGSFSTQTQEYQWTGGHSPWRMIRDSSGTLPEADDWICITSTAGLDSQRVSEVPLLALKTLESLRLQSLKVAIYIEVGENTCQIGCIDILLVIVWLLQSLQSL